MTPASTYYKALGVTPDCSDVAIKEAYRELARLHHPDMPGGTEEAMQTLTEACQGLKDRRAYNTMLAFRFDLCKRCRGRGTTVKGFAGKRQLCPDCEGAGYFVKERKKS